VPYAGGITFQESISKLPVTPQEYPNNKCISKENVFGVAT
jgi:hypothetical protein